MLRSLRPAFYATIVAIANSVQPSGICDRQRAEHHGVDQREDRRRSADSQSQRQDRRSRKNRRPPELSQGVTKIAEQVLHGIPL